jgi:hypothetical protein
MKSINFSLVRYDADEGMVFDWKDPRFIEETTAEGEKVEVQEHLYAKTLFIGGNDSIDNYVEVEMPVVETTENI